VPKGNHFLNSQSISHLLMLLYIFLREVILTSVDIVEGHQFPDKAIDLIDEACATARMQTDNILKGTSTQHGTENAMKEAIVSPCQVAQV
jgi:hypothetical protein